MAQTYTSPRILSSALAAPWRLLRTLAFDPVATGLLLYVLSKCPADARSQLSARTGLATETLYLIISPLKWLFALGLIRRVHQSLDKLASNNWHLSKPGEPWKFGDDKLSELVLITGGCSGFGRLMAKGFVGQAKVAILDIADLPDDLKGLPSVHYYQCDITDPTAISSVAASIREQHGDPSVLINNAGIAIGTSVLDASNEYTEKIFKVNVISHFFLIKEFLPAMLKARKGHIVTVASIASYVALPPIVHYCCTKTAANYLNDGLRTELLNIYPNGDTILTTSVHPTFHDTPMISSITGDASLTGDPVYPPENVSDKVVEQVLNARSGKLFIPEGQYYISFLKFSPTWFVDLVQFARSRSKRRAAAAAAEAKQGR